MAKFSAEEREAMKERAKELRATKTREEGEADLHEKISAMTPEEQVIAKRLHEIVTSTAPHLVPKTWYGMPAWARDGKVVCFFQAASKFKVRYNTFGFNEDARLDDGEMWSTSFALTSLTPAVEKELVRLIQRGA